MRTYRILYHTLALLGCSLLIACQDQARDTALRPGYEALDQKQYDQAIDLADRYLATNPAGTGAAEAQYLRGRAIEQRVKRSAAESAANLREAAAAYDHALKLNPSRQLEAYIRTSLGNVLYWQDEFEAAEEHWTAAYQRLDREDLKAWILYRIGLSQQRLGKWTVADATFEAVAQHYPGTEATQRALAHHGAKEFYVQVAAFQTITSAEKLMVTLRSQGFQTVRITKPQNNLQIVMAGPQPDYRRAAAVRARIVSAGYKDAMIVP